MPYTSDYIAVFYIYLGGLLFLENRKFDVSIVIINFNTPELVIRCLDSIALTTTLKVQTIVVDNASTDNSVEQIHSVYKDTTILQLDSNLGYGTAFNRALGMIDSDIVAISNTDVEFYEACIDRVVDYIRSDRDVGVCGVQQVYPDGSWQRSSGFLPGIDEGLYEFTGLNKLNTIIQKSKWKKKQNSTINKKGNAKDVQYVDGAVMFFRRSALEQVQGFDESIFFFAEDSDICWRLAKLGWKVQLLPSAIAMHIRGFTRKENTTKDVEYYALQMKSKYGVARKHLPEWKVRIAVILESLYYGEIIVVQYLMMLLTNPKQKEQRRHKIQVAQTIIQTLAVELERE
jgi:GT2 family glycosyltransferase